MSFQSSVVSTGVVNIAGAALALLTGSILARSLGPSGRGEFAAITGWPNFIATLMTMGLHSGATFFVPKNPEKLRRYWSTSLLVSFAASVGLGVLGWVVLPLLLHAQSSETVGAARRFLFLYAIPYLPWVLAMSAIQGLQDFRAWNVHRFVIQFIWPVLLLLAELAGVRSPSTLSLFFVATWIVAAPWAIWQMHRRSSGTYRPESALVRPLLGYGFPTVLASFPRQLNQRLDQMFMASLAAPQILGYYAAAVAVTMPISLFIAPIANVINPHVARLSSRDEQASLIGRTGRITMLISMALATLVMIAAPIGILVLFGRSFWPAATPALILIPAAVLNGAVLVLEDALLGLGRPRAVLRAELVGLAVTGVGLLTTLPTIPLIGAACTSLFTYGMTLWMVANELHEVLSISRRELLLPRRSDVREIAARISQAWRSLRAARNARISEG